MEVSVEYFRTCKSLNFVLKRYHKPPIFLSTITSKNGIIVPADSDGYDELILLNFLDKFLSLECLYEVA